MAWGGKREGSGRKRGLASVLAEKTRDYIAQRVVDEQEELVNAQMEKAKKGDTGAFKELFDRAGFKVKEELDVTTDGEKIVFLPAELMRKNGIESTPSTESDSPGPTQV